MLLNKTEIKNYALKYCSYEHDIGENISERTAKML